MYIRLRNVKTGDAIELAPGEHGVGREDDNAVIVDDGSVSRHHARLSLDPAGMFVEDLGSSNGTALRGYLVVQKSKVEIADVLYFGNVAFEVEAANPPADAPIQRPEAELQQVGEKVGRIRKPTDLVRLDGAKLEEIRASQRIPVVTDAPKPEPKAAQPPIDSQSLRRPSVTPPAAEAPRLSAGPPAEQEPEPAVRRPPPKPADITNLGNSLRRGKTTERLEIPIATAPEPHPLDAAPKVSRASAQVTATPVPRSAAFPIWLMLVLAVGCGIAIGIVIGFYLR
jgi:hypothetical protein